MSKQLAKRLTEAWVVNVLERFNQHQIAELEARELLGLGRSRFYKLRKQWLKKKRTNSFHLQASGGAHKKGFEPAIESFLHEELSYLRKEAYHYRGKFNFAYLVEKVDKKFNVLIHRNSIRRFALKHRYYHKTTPEKQKPCIRFEMDAIGALFQHDTSVHVWLPCSGRYHDLLMTKDDHSRRVVAFDLREVESA